MYTYIKRRVTTYGLLLIAVPLNDAQDLQIKHSSVLETLPRFDWRKLKEIWEKYRSVAYSRQEPAKIQQPYFPLMKRAWARVREFEMRKTTQGLFSRTSRYFSTTSFLPAYPAHSSYEQRSPGGRMSPRKWAAFSNCTMIIRIIATRIIRTMIRKIARTTPLGSTVYHGVCFFAFASCWTLRQLKLIAGSKSTRAAWNRVVSL